MAVFFCTNRVRKRRTARLLAGTIEGGRRDFLKTP